jgi:hypothetical protein
VQNFTFTKNYEMEQIQMDAEHQAILELIGKRVTELRTTKKIKIKEITDWTGIHRNAYRQLEHGQTYFKVSALLRILDFHKISYKEFFKDL